MISLILHGADQSIAQRPAKLLSALSDSQTDRQFANRNVPGAPSSIHAINLPPLERQGKNTLAVLFPGCSLCFHVIGHIVKEQILKQIK